MLVYSQSRRRGRRGGGTCACNTVHLTKDFLMVLGGGGPRGCSLDPTTNAQSCRTVPFTWDGTVAILQHGVVPAAVDLRYEIEWPTGFGDPNVGVEYGQMLLHAGGQASALLVLALIRMDADQQLERDDGKAEPVGLLRELVVLDQRVTYGGHDGRRRVVLGLVGIHIDPVRLREIFGH